MNEQLELYFPAEEGEPPVFALKAYWDGGDYLVLHTNGDILMDGDEPRQLLEFLKRHLEPELENE